jgi:hypothetical protein
VPLGDLAAEDQAHAGAARPSSSTQISIAAGKPGSRVQPVSTLPPVSSAASTPLRRRLISACSSELFEVRVDGELRPRPQDLDESVELDPHFASTARSTAWSSSRTLPGQACSSSPCMAPASKPVMRLR